MCEVGVLGSAIADKIYPDYLLKTLTSDFPLPHPSMLFFCKILVKRLLYAASMKFFVDNNIDLSHK